MGDQRLNRIVQIIFILTILCYAIFQTMFPHISAFAKYHAHLVDIDIGTNGRAMHTNATKLISFDPADSLLLTHAYERYPIVISDFTGRADFYVNHEEPGCSSLNKRNEKYDPAYRDTRISSRCGNLSFETSRLYKCMHSNKIQKKVVKVERLSAFLKERRIDEVNFLKIDAQGGDFAIVKDVFENSAHISFKQIQVECQDYRDAVPLYFSSNDCDDIVSYVTQRYPNVRLRKVVNNCTAAEYNILFQMNG